MKRNQHGTSTREERAEQVLNSSGVKLQKFNPSGKELWTVLGSEGDLLVDISDKRSSYCSCDDFYFRVQAGQVRECYHLIAARRAKESGSYATLFFSDEEYQPFVQALLTDIFSRIG